MNRTKFQPNLTAANCMEAMETLSAALDHYASLASADLHKVALTLEPDARAVFLLEIAAQNRARWSGGAHSVKNICEALVREAALSLATDGELLRAAPAPAERPQPLGPALSNPHEMNWNAKNT